MHTVSYSTVLTYVHYKKNLFVTSSFWRWSIVLKVLLPHPLPPVAQPARCSVIRRDDIHGRARSAFRGSDGFILSCPPASL